MCGSDDLSCRNIRCHICGCSAPLEDGLESVCFLECRFERLDCTTNTPANRRMFKHNLSPPSLVAEPRLRNGGNTRNRHAMLPRGCNDQPLVHVQLSSSHQACLPSTPVFEQLVVRSWTNDRLTLGETLERYITRYGNKYGYSTTSKLNLRHRDVGRSQLHRSTIQLDYKPGTVLQGEQ
jgi:hypothetical protein